MSKYTPTIGIETHVQLKTKTKLFSAVGNDASQAQPNTLISHICVGLPGALPVLNEKALELAARAAFALNTQPQKNSYFERKHYFYPDSPTGYQISQLHAPIIIGGSVDLMSGDKKKTIGINRAQLEADAGKNTHPADADYSLVDLNRAGTPLLEIVSEPEIHSAAEAKAYVRELYLLMKYAGISDVDLYLGHMRFDVNVSLNDDPNKLGTRAEIKNLNSFRSVENAVAFEIERQTELLKKGQTVVQETRGWDEDTQKTTGQRGKEEAQDYRYMPEPDIPPIELSDEFISKIKDGMPELPGAIRTKLKDIDVTSDVIEDILDNPDFTARLIEAVNKTRPDIARQVIFQLLENPRALKLSVSEQIALGEMVTSNVISSSAAKEILLAKIESPGKSIDELASSKKQVSDEGEIERIVTEVLGENTRAAEDVKAGEAKAIGFLVGQVMAKSHGKANPGMAQEIIKKQLGI